MQDPWHNLTPRLTHRGWEGKKISSPSRRGRKMSLTSPLIDRDLTSTIRLAQSESGKSKVQSALASRESASMLLKTINYRGGIIRFQIPNDWVEEYEDGGGGGLYKP